MTDKLVKIPLSNIDLNNLLNDINIELDEKRSINIYTVAQMTKNPSKFIKDLNKNGYSVIFIENRGTQIGHWVILFTGEGGSVNLFDSYGNHPDKLDVKLTQFLKTYFDKVRFNTMQYQKYGKDIATCGRWAMFVLGLRRIFGKKLTLEKIHEIIMAYKKATGLSFDKIMAKLINSKV